MKPAAVNFCVAHGHVLRRAAKHCSFNDGFVLESACGPCEIVPIAEALGLARVLDALDNALEPRIRCDTRTRRVVHARSLLLVAISEGLGDDVGGHGPRSVA